MQHRDAFLVLPKRGRPAAGARVELHQRPVDRLLRRIQRQQSQRRLDRRLDELSPRLVLEQASEHSGGAGTQALALGSQMILERAFAHADAHEQVAFV